jgi:7-keto-8-aminopelargonate synthetase-like enzyme
VGVESEVDIVVGTLSKAVGQLGGFVCASSDLCALLTNAARPMIYSTALPEPVVRGALAALEVNAAEPQLRETLWARVRQLESLTGFPPASPCTSAECAKCTA